MIDPTWPQLHIYPQDFWHAPAFILGNRPALELLRDAINEALAAEDGLGAVRDWVIPADTEGYPVGVILRETVQELPVPYLGDEYLQGKNLGDWRQLGIDSDRLAHLLWHRPFKKDVGGDAA